MLHDLDDLMSSTDVARFLGVSQPAVSNYKNRHPTFPDPLVVVSNGRSPLYSRESIVKWWKSRNPALAAAIREEE